jgi:hypothetical protein
MNPEASIKHPAPSHATLFKLLRLITKPLTMIKNYLLIAVRNLTKNFGYTAINIFGLAIGLACCLLVTLYIRFELSYENFHENKASIYRYIPRGERDGKVSMQTMLPAGFGPLINDSFREVEKVYPIFRCRRACTLTQRRCFFRC